MVSLTINYYKSIFRSYLKRLGIGNRKNINLLTVRAPFLESFQSLCTETQELREHALFTRQKMLANP